MSNWQWSSTGVEASLRLANVADVASKGTKPLDLYTEKGLQEK